MLRRVPDGALEHDVHRVLAPLQGTRHSDDLSQLSLDEIERRHILRVLDACQGNKTLAAKTLQIDYKTLLTKLKKYGVGEAAEG